MISALFISFSPDSNYWFILDPGCQWGTIEEGILRRNFRAAWPKSRKRANFAVKATKTCQCAPVTWQPFEENKLVRVVFYRRSWYTARLISDCAMVLFGIWLVHEDDAPGAVKAAPEIHKYVDTPTPEETQQTMGRILGMQMGIKSGIVLAGVARPGESVMGEATYLLLKGEFLCEAPPHQTVKSKKEALAACSIFGRKVRDKNPEGMTGRRSVLPGRDTEFGILFKAPEDLSSGQGSFIRFRAEAGVATHGCLKSLNPCWIRFAMNGMKAGHTSIQRTFPTPSGTISSPDSAISTGRTIQQACSGRFARVQKKHPVPGRPTLGLSLITGTARCRETGGRLPNWSSS